MQLGLVGVGRMGAGMIERLRRAGHDVVGYDLDPGLSDVESLPDLVTLLRRPRHIWIMVPCGAPIENTIEELANLLDPGDLVVEGGNSRWTDDGPRAAKLSANKIGYVDCGVSGGVWSSDQGYALMAGGSEEHVERLMPIFDALKPPGNAGFVHAGPVGAGHYAKMVHIGIEYSLMESYAEGFELLQATDVVRDVAGVMASWTEGTVIRSWLLDLALRSLAEDPELNRPRGYEEDSREGRRTVEAGIEAALPTASITAAPYARFASRQDASPAMRLVAALRREFGGDSVSGAAPGREGDQTNQPPV